MLGKNSRLQGGRDPRKESAMPKRLEGKRVVLIGSGQQPGLTTGIGRAIALLFAEHHATLILVDKHEAGARETKAMIDSHGGRATIHVADVTDAGACAELAEYAQSELGGVDVLVNSVGILGNGTALEASEELWHRVMDTNLKSMWLTARAFLPLMISQGGGSIVNVSSIGSLGGPNLAYGVSKAGVNRLTISLAASYAPHNVRANAVLPGLIDTPMAIEGGLDTRGLPASEREAFVTRRDAAVPMAYKGSARDVAHAALFFASDESRYVSGALLPVDGALAAASW
jgi:NAD(P)-dependent dehydrogenase (short-subunit alcohol dehydrogenase family)